MTSKSLRWHDPDLQKQAHMEGSVHEEYAWIVPEVLREFMVYEKMLSENL